jgi:hypothetical protein
MFQNEDEKGSSGRFGKYCNLQQTCPRRGLLRMIDPWSSYYVSLSIVSMNALIASRLAEHESMKFKVRISDNVIADLVFISSFSAV